MDASSLSLNEAREAARRLGNRVRNIKRNADTVAQRTTMLLVGTASAFGMGWYMGGLEYERSTLSDGEIDEDGDPTTWFGMPRDLVVGSGLAAATFFNLGGKRIQDTLTNASMGIFCGWAKSVAPPKTNKSRYFFIMTPHFIQVL